MLRRLYLVLKASPVKKGLRLVHSVEAFIDRFVDHRLKEARVEQRIAELRRVLHLAPKEAAHPPGATLDPRPVTAEPVAVASTGERASPVVRATAESATEEGATVASRVVGATAVRAAEEGATAESATVASPLVGASATPRVGASTVASPVAAPVVGTTATPVVGAKAVAARVGAKATSVVGATVAARVGGAKVVVSTAGSAGVTAPAASASPSPRNKGAEIVESPRAPRAPLAAEAEKQRSVERRPGEPPSAAKPEEKKQGKPARRPPDPLTQLIEALEAHPKRAGLVLAGRQKDQLLRSLIPLYLAQGLPVPVSSGTTSRFWAKQGVKYAAPNAAKALREHEGYTRRTASGPRITPAGVKYVEAALAGHQTAS